VDCWNIIHYVSINWWWNEIFLNNFVKDWFVTLNKIWFEHWLIVDMVNFWLILVCWFNCVLLYAFLDIWKKFVFRLLKILCFLRLLRHFLISFELFKKLTLWLILLLGVLFLSFEIGLPLLLWIIFWWILFYILIVLLIHYEDKIYKNKSL